MSLKNKLTGIGLAIALSFGPSLNANANEIKEDLINSFNQRRDGSIVIDLDIYYDEEYKRKYGEKTLEKVIENLGFAAENFEKEAYNGQDLDVTLNINLINEWDSEDGVGNIFYTFREGKLELEKQENTEAVIIFSRERNNTNTIGITSAEEGYVIINDNGNLGEKYTTGHELFHLLGAIDRNFKHPNYNEESIMSYGFSNTSKLDQVNKKLVFENRCRSWEYEDKGDEIKDSLKQFDEETKKLVLHGIYATTPDLTDEAIEIFEELTKKFPLNPDLFNFLGDAYYVKKDFGSSVLNYKKTLELNPDDYDALNSLAWIYVYDLKINFEEGLDLAKKAYDLHPSTYIKDTLAVALYQNRFYEEAYNLEIEVVRELPFYEDLFSNLARICQKLGKEDEAILNFIKAIEREMGSNPEPYYELGDIYLSNWDLKEALKYTIQSSDVAYKEHFIFGYYYEYGDLKYLEKEVEVIMKILENPRKNKELINKNRFSFDLNALSWMYLERHTNPVEALALAIKAGYLKPNQHNIEDTLALAYFRNGFYDDAIKYERKALEHHEDLDYYERLILMLKKTDKDYADELNGAISFIGDDHRDLNYFASFLVKDLKAELDTAEELILKALSKKPHSGDYNSTYGTILAEKEEYEKAISYFNIALGNFLYYDTKEKIYVYVYLSKCYNAINEPELAEQHLEEARKLESKI